MIRIAVVGAGTRGLRHLRALRSASDAVVTMVCDSGADARRRALAEASHAAAVRAGARLGDALTADDVDAVIIATPSACRTAHARAALRAGKHVLVESPMAMRVADATSVATAAEAANRTLMVGHTMLYHPAITHMRTLGTDDTLGQVLYARAQHVYPGRVYTDESALWRLGADEVATLLYVIGDMPQSVSARGGSYLVTGVEDVVFLTMRFPAGLLAELHLSWLDPRTERSLYLVSKQTRLEFDSVASPPTLALYHRDKTPMTQPATVPVAQRDPHHAMIQAFVDCIRKGTTPTSDGACAVGVIRVLAAAQESLDADGTPVVLTET